MSKDKTEPPDDHTLIMAAATLAELSQEAPTLAPLASQALKMVLDSNTAVSKLVISYKQSQQPQQTGPQMPSQIRAQSQSAAIKQLQEALKQLQGNQ